MLLQVSKIFVRQLKEKMAPYDAVGEHHVDAARAMTPEVERPARLLQDVDRRIAEKRARRRQLIEEQI
jgi:hypothetical protein